MTSGFSVAAFLAAVERFPSHPPSRSRQVHGITPIDIPIDGKPHTIPPLTTAIFESTTGTNSGKSSERGSIVKSHSKGEERSKGCGLPTALNDKRPENEVPRKGDLVKQTSNGSEENLARNPLDNDFGSSLRKRKKNGLQKERLKRSRDQILCGPLALVPSASIGDSDFGHAADSPRSEDPDPIEERFDYQSTHVGNNRRSVIKRKPLQALQSDLKRPTKDPQAVRTLRTGTFSSRSFALSDGFTAEELNIPAEPKRHTKPSNEACDSTSELQLAPGGPEYPPGWQHNHTVPTIHRMETPPRECPLDGSSHVVPDTSMKRLSHGKKTVTFSDQDIIYYQLVAVSAPARTSSKSDGDSSSDYGDDIQYRLVDNEDNDLAAGPHNNGHNADPLHTEQSNQPHDFELNNASFSIDPRRDEYLPDYLTRPGQIDRMKQGGEWMEVPEEIDLANSPAAMKTSTGMP